MNDGLVDIKESITGNVEEFKTKMRSGRATGRDLANLFGMGEMYDKSKERNMKVSFSESVAESMTGGTSSRKSPGAVSKIIHDSVKDLTTGIISNSDMDACEIFNVIADNIEQTGADVEWNYGKYLGEHSVANGWFTNDYKEVGREATFKITTRNSDGKELVFMGHPYFLFRDSQGYSSVDFSNDFVPQEVWNGLRYTVNAYFTKMDPRHI